jgi:hypothetical protein
VCVLSNNVSNKFDSHSLRTNNGMHSTSPKALSSWNPGVIISVYSVVMINNDKTSF